MMTVVWSLSCNEGTDLTRDIAMKHVTLASKQHPPKAVASPFCVLAIVAVTKATLGDNTAYQQIMNGKGC
jgi:hypothetical protein